MFPQTIFDLDQGLTAQRLADEDALREIRERVAKETEVTILAGTAK